MGWSGYGTFVVLAVVLVLVPGPDVAVVLRNTLAGGRARGSWSAAGITVSNVLQGTAAATGLAALVVRVEPLFQVIRWAGVAYLTYLALQAFRSAVRGRYADLEAGGAATGRDALTGLPFAAANGTPMREWVALDHGTPESDLALAEEAMAFVAAGRRA